MSRLRSGMSRTHLPWDDMHCPFLFSHFCIWLNSIYEFHTTRVKYPNTVVLIPVYSGPRQKQYTRPLYPHYPTYNPKGGVLFILQHELHQYHPRKLVDTIDPRGQGQVHRLRRAQLSRSSARVDRADRHGWMDGPVGSWMSDPRGIYDEST